MYVDFLEHIDREIQQRGWTRNGLATRAGLSNSYFSMLLKGRTVGLDACKKIALALRVPETEVMAWAGLLQDEVPGQDEMAYIYAHLPPERQEELRNYARYLLDQQDKRDAPAARPSPADA
jgi:transcriptional regulator with XRE-family HTH domain